MSLPLSEVSVNKQTRRHLRAESVALQYLASRASVKVTLFLLLNKNVLCYVSESEERHKLVLGLRSICEVPVEETRVGC